MALKHTREEGRFLKSFKIMIIYMQHYIYKIRPEWVKLKKIKLLHLHLLLNTASSTKEFFFVVNLSVTLGRHKCLSRGPGLRR